MSTALYVAALAEYNLRASSGDFEPKRLCVLQYLAAARSIVVLVSRPDQSKMISRRR
jgi:hypothetical protein